MTEQKDTSSNIRRKVGLVGAAGLTAASTLLGCGGEAKPAPGANQTRIAVLQTAVVEKETRDREEQAIRDLESRLAGPTATPNVVATATAQAKEKADIADASARYRGALQATATAAAEKTLATATPVAERDSEGGGGIPGITPIIKFIKKFTLWGQIFK